jgi:hypothetical protein
MTTAFVVTCTVHHERTGLRTKQRHTQRRPERLNASRFHVLVARQPLHPAASQVLDDDFMNGDGPTDGQYKPEPHLVDGLAGVHSLSPRRPVHLASRWPSDQV